MPQLYDPARNDEAHRTTEFRKPVKLETLLDELNALLAPCQQAVTKQYIKPRFPLLLLVGLPRSGTTLFLQWLADSKQWGYPSNIISRFYAAPYIGARVQQILLDNDYRNQISGFQETAPYSSSLGTTRGATAPHEFWYFWRRYFTFSDETDVVSSADLQKIDIAHLNAELATLEAALNKPLALKAMLLNWHIPFLDSIFDKVLFVHVKRDPIFVMQSIMDGRRKNFGSEDRWYSFKPPEYVWLKELDPCHQVAGQVRHILKAVSDGLSQVPESRKLEVDYECFCDQPAAIWKDLQEKMAAQGSSLGAYQGPDRFEAMTSIRVSSERWEEFQNAFLQMSREG
jgi:hypothetical protein